MKMFSSKLTVLLFGLSLVISPSAFAEKEDPPESLVSTKSDSHDRRLTDEERAARAEQRQLKKSLKAYKRVKDKAWEDLSRREKKYAKKNGIETQEAYDAWKAQMAEASEQQRLAREAAKAAQQAARQAKKEMKAYRRVKDKEWEELSSREKKYAEENGITSKEIYDAWKAKQAALYAQRNGQSDSSSSAVASQNENRMGRQPASAK